MNLAAAVAAAALALVVPAPSADAAVAPKVGHVFTIVLENKDYEKTFGPDSTAPYLSKTLVGKGALLSEYFGTGHASLDNYISMVSGQAPNPQTQSDCQLFTDFAPPVIGADGQAVGNGCVYPAQVLTVADQLEAKGVPWKGYMEDMGDDPSREAATCAHPAIGDRDPTQAATEKDQYATRHNPFMYFHSVIDDRAQCNAHVVNLDALTADLASTATTPAYSFITPDLCSDGHDETCADPKQKGGYAGIDEFLRAWVPKILAAPAFRKDGLLVITFDEAEDDSTACCGEPTGPNTPMPGIQGPGGGKIGAVLIGPSVEPGTRSEEPINHYGYLRSIEDIFGLDHLGYAGMEGLATFGSMGVLDGRPPASTPPAPPAVERFAVKRKQRRLVIAVRLAPGVTGRLVIRRKGKVVRRRITARRSVVRVRVRRGAKVVLRARRGGKTVQKVSRRG